MNKVFSLAPNFDPGKVKLFFEMLEKISVQLDWPEKDWMTLIQGSFTRMAQEAHVAMEKVKTILQFDKQC